MKQEFKYTPLEAFFNKLILIIAICVVALLIFGFIGKAPMNIVSTVNVFLVGVVNLLNSFVFRRKNIKISVLLLITGIAIISILVAGIAINGL